MAERVSKSMSSPIAGADWLLESFMEARSQAFGMRELRAEAAAEGITGVGPYMEWLESQVFGLRHTLRTLQGEL